MTQSNRPNHEDTQKQSTPNISLQDSLQKLAPQSNVGDTLAGILHPERQESFDNLINGIACHYEHLGKGVTTAHAADKYDIEYVAGQLQALVSQQVNAALDVVENELPDDSIITTKYGYHRDEKKYGFRIAITEVKALLSKARRTE